MGIVRRRRGDERGFAGASARTPEARATVGA
jgi:hypothetical protein